MKGKITIFSLLLLLIGIHLSHAESFPTENSLRVGSFINVKYGYFSAFLDYHSKPFFLKERAGLFFGYEGFRQTKYFLGEVNRFRVEGYTFLPGQNGPFYLRARLGMSLFFDLSDMSQPNKGLSFAPQAGFDILYTAGRHLVLSEQSLTFYIDGLWLEIAPEYQFQIADRFSVSTRWNTVLALTYNGNFSAGLYPSLLLGFHF